MIDVDFAFWVPVVFLLCLATITYYRTKGAPQKGESGHRRYSMARSLAGVLGAVTICQAFIVQLFVIPSASMEPTLSPGDYVPVQKYSYRWVLPVIGTELATFGHPARGDVAVFRFPSDPSKTYIKRVVGLPGETVSIKNGVVSINGHPLPTDRSETYTVTNGLWEGYATETSSGRNYHVRHSGAVAQGTRQLSVPANTEGTWNVPEGSYFVLGDNRSNSVDSRFIGMIPESNFIGRVSGVVMSWPHKTELPTFTTISLAETRSPRGGV